MFQEELAQYRILCCVLSELHLKHENQKITVIQLLEEMAELHRRIVKEFGRTFRLSRRLTGLQRKELGLLYISGENFIWNKYELFFHSGPSLKPASEPVPEYPETCKNLRQLRAAEINTLYMVDAVKKELLRLELMEMRLRELIYSIIKALEAYDHELRKILRYIYPLGIVSICFKSLRVLWGAPHFSRRDLDQLSFLGNLTRNIISMADCPAF